MSGTTGARPVHAAGRFFGSLRPGPPSAAARQWARGFLGEREAVLFDRMSNPDQRHAVAVARAVATALEEPEGVAVPEDRRQAVMAAALLHDVGKTAAGLRTYGRVVATLSGWAGGRGFAEVWQDMRGFTRKVGLYLRYPELGAEMLQLAGSDPWVVAWAREHHRPEEEWTVPLEVGRILSGADR